MVSCNAAFTGFSLGTCERGHRVYPYRTDPSRHVQVLMWDVRGGRAPTAQLGAYGPARHPLLASVKLRNALAAVPGKQYE